jgi:hypothetical protein
MSSAAANSGNENNVDMEMLQIEVLETFSKSRDEVLADFDRIGRMRLNDPIRTKEIEKYTQNLNDLVDSLKSIIRANNLDKETNDELWLIYNSVKSKKINAPKMPEGPAQSFFLPNITPKGPPQSFFSPNKNSGFSVKTPAPQSQGPVNSFNIFSPRPQAQATRAKGFNSLSPLEEAQFAQPQGYANSFNVFSPLAQAPKATMFSPKAKHGGSKKTQRKRMNRKRKSLKSRD